MKNKRITIFLLLLVTFFFSINSVKAYSCAEIQKNVDKYNQIKEELSKLDCTITDDEKIVNSCNSLRLDKNAVLTNIYQSKDDSNKCGTTKNNVTSILKENENDCGTVFNGDLKKFTNNVMNIFYIIGPILLILFGTLDFSRATISGEKDALNKAGKRFSKRLLATILLFLSPVIVNIIISFNTSGYNLKGDAYVCNYTNSVYKKKYTIKYTPKIKKGKNNNTNVDFDSEYMGWKQYGSAPWAGIRLGSGSDTTIAKIGCTTVSIAIQIANSGVASSSFSPAELANSIKSGGGYTSGGAMLWIAASNAWQNVAPGFKHEREVTISGDKASKEAQLANYINQGYYPVVEVKCNETRCSNQHWVAAVGVQGNSIVFADPGSGSNDVANNSKYTFSNPSCSKRVELYKVEK